MNKEQNFNSSTSPAIVGNNVLPAVLFLDEPEKYKGYSKHPTVDNTIRQVVSAKIKPCEYSSTGWVFLEIKFADGETFVGSSPSARGAKHMFAFQCSKGSKWSVVINGR